MKRIFSRRSMPTADVTWRQLSGFAGHEFIIALTDQASGLQAYVAVHSRALGIAHGGTRFKAYDTQDEALNDALRLSQAMSYKSALASLPYGGAKAVIIDIPGTNKQAVLQAYAKKIQALGGLFHTGTDVGLTDQDVLLMAQDCQYMLGVSPGNKAGYSTSKAAAQGVYLAMKAACQQRYNTASLQGLTVGIKGLGKLGGQLAELLLADGCKLLVADVHTDAATALQAKYPEQVTTVDSNEIANQTMQIYAPCALGYEFTTESVTKLNCEIICGGANNQLESDAIGELIAKKGITYVPDYIANAGGLIFVSEDLEANGFQLERLEQRLTHIGQVVTEVLLLAAHERSATNLVATQLAEQRIARDTK
jgi:valine dehydrogenase (NAD+)